MFSDLDVLANQYIKKMCVKYMHVTIASNRQSLLHLYLAFKEKSKFEHEYFGEHPEICTLLLEYKIIDTNQVFYCSVVK